MDYIDPPTTGDNSNGGIDPPPGDNSGIDTTKKDVKRDNIAERDDSNGRIDPPTGDSSNGGIDTMKKDVKRDNIAERDDSNGGIGPPTGGSSNGGIDTMKKDDENNRGGGVKRDNSAGESVSHPDAVRLQKCVASIKERYPEKKYCILSYEELIHLLNSGATTLNENNPLDRDVLRPLGKLEEQSYKPVKSRLFGSMKLGVVDKIKFVESLTPCCVCAELVDPTHKCVGCRKSLHAWCGEPVEGETYNNRCVACQETKENTSPTILATASKEKTSPAATTVLVLSPKEPQLKEPQPNKKPQPDELSLSNPKLPTSKHELPSSKEAAKQNCGAGIPFEKSLRRSKVDIRCKSSLITSKDDGSSIVQRPITRNMTRLLEQQPKTREERRQKRDALKMMQPPSPPPPPPPAQQRPQHMTKKERQRLLKEKKKARRVNETGSAKGPAAVVTTRSFNGKVLMFDEIDVPKSDNFATAADVDRYCLVDACANICVLHYKDLFTDDDFQGCRHFFRDEEPRFGETYKYFARHGLMCNRLDDFDSNKLKTLQLHSGIYLIKIKVWDADETNHWFHAVVFDANKGWLFDNDKNRKIIRIINPEHFTKKDARNVFTVLMGSKKHLLTEVYQVKKASNVQKEKIFQAVSNSRYLGSEKRDDTPWRVVAFDLDNGCSFNDVLKEIMQTSTKPALMDKCGRK